MNKRLIFLLVLFLRVQSLVSMSCLEFVEYVHRNFADSPHKQVVSISDPYRALSAQAMTACFPTDCEDTNPQLPFLRPLPTGKLKFINIKTASEEVSKACIGIFLFGCPFLHRLLLIAILMGMVEVDPAAIAPAGYDEHGRLLVLNVKDALEHVTQKTKHCDGYDQFLRLKDEIVRGSTRPLGEV